MTLGLHPSLVCGIQISLLLIEDGDNLPFKITSVNFIFRIITTKWKSDLIAIKTAGHQYHMTCMNI